MAQAPGTNITVTAAASNTQTNNPTGTWFALGVAAGPANIPVPIQSMSDFNAVFGQIVNGQITGRYALTNVNSTLLYDSLDVFFREGGMQAFVVRVAPGAGTVATSAALGGVWKLTANGPGTWANSSSASAAGVILTVNYISTGNYSATIAYNGNVNAAVSGLSGDNDVINWVNSLPGYQSMVTAASMAGTSTLPTTAIAPLIVYLTLGADIAVADADAVTALAAITDAYGPGQVSYPGNTGAAVYTSIANHCVNFNRVALLDVVNTPTAATMSTAVATFQSNAAVLDPSYAGFFGPWLTCPGVVNTNPSATNPYAFNRTVPPVALVAANISRNDAGNDANVPAAGVVNGSANYVTGVTQSYVASDRAALNAAGVNVVRNIPNTGTIAIYGFRSAALNPNWTYLSNVRFRMQIIEQFDSIAEGFVFQEIDGKGQLFGKLAGALGAQCQLYWLRGSLYGATAGSAYVVNVGSSVNTPSTIALGQINAVVSLKMSPFGEFVNISVAKYSVTASLPQ